MFNKLTCKVRFHIAVWSLSKSIRASSFIETLSSNQRKTNRFPAKFAREAPRKTAVLYQSFFSETDLENSREIGRFFREFAPENPAKFDFFFRDLPEALSKTVGKNVKQAWEHNCDCDSNIGSPY